jgi:hypothetical protein
MRKNNVPYPEMGVAHCKMQVVTERRCGEEKVVR